MSVLPDPSVVLTRHDSNDQTSIDQTAAALVHAALTVSRTSGPQLFFDLVADLAATLAVDAVMIAVFTDEQHTHLQTRAVVLDGRLLQNFVYPLEGSPCKAVMGRDFRYVERGVASEFAPGTLFMAQSMDSYAGHTVTDGTGQMIGLLVALSRQPIANAMLAEAMLKIYAVRMAAEFDRLRAEDALREAALAVSSAQGAEVFPELTQYLARQFGVESAFIAVLDPNKPDQLKTLAMLVDGRQQSEYRYSIAGSPCATVLGRSFKLYPDRLGEIFPEDIDFRAYGAQSYAGFPLFDESGAAIGLISILSRRPMMQTERIEPIMRIFAMRASAEISRQRSESALRRSEANYRAIFEAAEDAIFVHDWDTRLIVDANPKACEVYGYAYDEMIGKSVAQVSAGVAPFDEVQSEQRVALAKAGEVVRFEWHRQGPDQSLHWDEVRLKRARIGGQPRILAFAREITERKLAEEALRASEEQYRTIFNASAYGLALLDASGSVVDANPTFAQLFAYSREDILRIGASALLPDGRPGGADHMQDSSASAHPSHGEYRGRRSDGSMFDMEVHGAPIEYRGRPHRLLIVRDITDRKHMEQQRTQLEAQLRQAQKMEAIGQLTGGIAHDFNNILTSVLGYIVLASERAEALGDARIGRQLEQAQIAAQRARALISQMLTFSRRQRGERAPHALAPIVDRAVHLLRSTMRSSIELETALQPAAGAAAVDPVQIEQVLLNLCINARDAVEGAGQIQIGLRNAALSDCVCASCSGNLTGRWLELSVSDTGSGIAPEVLGRMFEPFFTTKDVGRGTGMGLAMVHGIVHEHGGHVLVETASGRGTRFRVLLPMVDEAVVAVPAAEATESGKRPVLRGRVMIVEDQPMVAEFMAELLQGWGLEVTVHHAPVRAEQWFREDPRRIDLVITDQTMPRMTGMQLATRLTALRPGLPVLMYSGYAEEIDAADLELAGVSVLLRKPLDHAALREELQRRLGPARSQPPAS